MQGRRILLWFMSSLLSATTSTASSENNIDELNKAVQNPIANLVSIPFQNNFNFNVGKNKQIQYILNSEC